jgi:hypothetical protein
MLGCSRSHRSSHLPLVLGGEVGLGLQGQVQEVLGVAPASGLEVPGGPEPLLGELPDRFQHGEPGFAVGVGPPTQRLVHQRAQPLQGIQAQSHGVAHRLGRLEGPPPGEDRQPGEQCSLGRTQKVVAPGDGPPEGPVAVRQGPGPGGEECQALLQPGEHLPGGQNLGPGGRQLDGQGQTVQPGGDLRHGRGVLLGQPEPGTGRQGPLGEQAHRLDPPERGQVREPVGLGRFQGGHHVLLLPPGEIAPPER